METKGKCGAEIRQRKPDSRNSETQEWHLKGQSRFQISHREKFEEGALEVLEVQFLGLVKLAPPTKKAKPGVSDSLYRRIVRNARNGEAWTRQDHGQSNRIRPNQTKSNQNQTGLARTNLDLGRARWMRVKAERMNWKANGLSNRNTFSIYDMDERQSGLAENLRLYSRMFAHLRVCSLN